MTRELCRLLRVSRATTYRRQVLKQIPVPLIALSLVAAELGSVTIKSQSTQNQAVNEENIFLRDEIEQLVLKNPWHGYRRITKLLARKGIHVNRKRVLRIMQLEKLICKRKKRFVPKTTDSNHAFRCYPNLLEKHKPQGLDEVWHADLTYIRVKESFVYVVQRTQGVTRACWTDSRGRLSVTRFQCSWIQCWCSRCYKWCRAMHAVRDEIQKASTWSDSPLGQREPARERTVYSDV